MATTMPTSNSEIRVFAMFPLDPTSTEPLSWNWVHCLTFPLDTLNKLQFTPKLYKWIRYATGVVVGAQGHLSFNRDSPHDVMDYNRDLRHEPTNLYYHISDAEKEKMFPVDPDMGRTSVTGSDSDVSSRRADFRSDVVERDGLCALTNFFRAGVCQAVHLLPHNKGDEYIKNYTRHRGQDETDIVCNIDDVRNGILLNPVAHLTFGTNIAFLMTPNFAMTTSDVDLTGTAPATEKRCTAHLFNLNEPDSFGDSGIHPGHQVRMPHAADSDWPPNILFDAVYATAVLRHFATQTMRDTLVRWKSKFYPGGITSAAQANHQALVNAQATQAQRRNKQNRAHDKRAAKRHADRAGDDCIDFFDCLQIMPYLMVPPDKQEEVWRRAAEKSAERERSRLEDKVVGWVNDVANARP